LIELYETWRLDNYYHSSDSMLYFFTCNQIVLYK